MVTQESISGDLLGDAIPADPRFHISDGWMIWMDGRLSILCQHNMDGDNFWNYMVHCDGTPITKLVKSKKAPYEDEPARRDPALRKLYGADENATSVEEVMCALDALGLYLLQHPEQLEAYENSIHPPEKTLKREKVELTDGEKKEALELLNDPKLVERIIEMIHENGLVGEHENGFSTFLTVLSTLTEEPSSLTCGGDTSTGKTALVKAVIPLFPPEMMFVRAGVTPKILYYDAVLNDEGELVNDLTGIAIIILEEEESEDFLKVIKPLLSHDQREIIYSYVNKGKDGNTTVDVKIVGHPSYIGLRARRIKDAQVKSRMMMVTPEFSTSKFEAVLDHVAHSAVAPWEHQSTMSPELPRNAIRMLERVDVVIPFMGVVREFFEYTSPRAVRDFGQFIAMVSTVATLHQFQRKHISVNGAEFVVAHMDDLDIALRLFELMYCEAVSGIPRDVKEFFERLVGLDDCCTHTKKTLFSYYKKATKGGKSINWFVERFVEPLVDLGLIEIDKSEKAYHYTIHAENLTASFKREKIIEELRKPETQARIRSEYTTDFLGNYRDTHTPMTEKMVDDVCVCYSVGYIPGRFDKVFGLCVTLEYPRRYSKSNLEDAVRSSGDEKSAEDVNEIDGEHIMRLIGEEVQKKAGRKEDAKTLGAIAVCIIETGYDPALVNYCMEKFRVGHRIYISPRERK